MNIIAVKYATHTSDDGTKEFTAKEYNYFCNIPVDVGDIITVPVRKSFQEAVVTEVNIPEERVGSILPFLKTIEAKPFETEEE